MHDMSLYEAEAYARGVARRYRAGWEQARMTAFAALKPWAKDLKMDQLVKFEWEESDEVMVNDEVELNHLRALLPEITKKMKKRHGGS